MIELELPLPPSGNDRNHIFSKRGKVVVKRKSTTQSYYEMVYYTFLESKQKTITEKCWAKIWIYCTNKNRDGDNVIKTLFDALQYGRVITNDKLIRRFEVDMIEGAKENKVVVQMGVLDSFS